MVAYHSLRSKIGHPLEPQTLIGPLIDKDAVEKMQSRIAQVKKEGGNILSGGEVLSGEGFETGNYVVPVLAEVSMEMKSVQEETFAPVLYLMKYKNFDEALTFTNKVGQLAEAEGHHPSILTEWGKVTVTWWTHKIKGLHRNDFIMAAKTDQLYQPSLSNRF